MNDDTDDNVLASIRIRVHVITPERLLQIRREMMPQIIPVENSNLPMKWSSPGVKGVIAAISVIIVTVALFSTDSAVGYVFGFAVLIIGGWWVLHSPRFASQDTEAGRED